MQMTILPSSYPIARHLNNLCKTYARTKCEYRSGSVWRRDDVTLYTKPFCAHNILLIALNPSAQDPNEAESYRWLADWERGHLSFLARLDKEIRMAVWNDQQFWPF
jgi:hypothetical protein